MRRKPEQALPILMKHLTLDGNQINTAISLKNNQLKLNGKTLQNEPDPDFDEGDMVSGQPH